MANQEKNSVFVCIKGFQLDGHIFAQDVIKRGAGAVVVKDIERTGTYVGVPARKIK